MIKHSIKTTFTFLIFFFSITAIQAMNDPTMPLTAPKANEKNEVPELLLQGIVIRKGIKFAAINGRFFKEGEQADGIKVFAIKKNKVLLKHWGKKEIVYLAPEVK